VVQSKLLANAGAGVITERMLFLSPNQSSESNTRTTKKTKQITTITRSLISNQIKWQLPSSKQW